MSNEVLILHLTIYIGEMPFVNDEDEVIRVVGENEKELNMIFIFSIVDIDNIPGGSRLSIHNWDARDLRRIVAKWQNVMRERGGWNSLFIENHVRVIAFQSFRQSLTASRTNLDLCLDTPTTLLNTVSLARSCCP